MPTIRPIFAWYDCWIGVFWDKQKRRLYVFPVPFFGVVVQFVRSECFHSETKEEKMAKSFVLCVEEAPQIEIELEWPGNEVPDVVFLQDRSMVIKSGRYLSPGDRYRFRRPNRIAGIENGRLLEAVNDFSEVK